MRLSNAVSSVRAEASCERPKPTTKAWAGRAMTKSVATMSSKPPTAVGPPHFAHKYGQATAATTPAIAADNSVGRMFKVLERRTGLAR